MRTVKKNTAGLARLVMWACLSSLLVLQGDLALAAPGQEVANPMLPGAWEVGTKTRVGAESGVHTLATVCVDQPWVESQKVFEAGPAEPVRDAASCSMEDYRRSDGQARWTTSCKLRSGAQAVISYDRKVGTDRLEYTTEVKVSGAGAAPRQLAIVTTMRRIGADCPAGAAKLTGPFSGMEAKTKTGMSNTR